MIWSALDLRSGFCLRPMNIEPVFPAPPPMNEMKWSMSGSSITILLSLFCRSRMDGNETSWGASEEPFNCPVSCWGKRPFGTMAARKTVRTTARTVSTCITIW